MTYSNIDCLHAACLARDLSCKNINLVEAAEVLNEKAKSLVKSGGRNILDLTGIKRTGAAGAVLVIAGAVAVVAAIVLGCHGFNMYVVGGFWESGTISMLIGLGCIRYWHVTLFRPLTEEQQETLIDAYREEVKLILNSNPKLTEETKKALTFSMKKLPQCSHTQKYNRN